MDRRAIAQFADSVRNDDVRLTQLGTVGVLLLDRGVEFGKCAIYASAFDIAMRHHAHRIEGGILRPNPLCMENVAKLDGGHAGGFAIENYNIGPDA
jgi:hypothetical protein